jgi:hypothetical protein
MLYQGLPSLHLAHNAAELSKTGEWHRNFEYDAERERELDFSEDLFNPLVIRWLSASICAPVLPSLRQPNNAMSQRWPNTVSRKSPAATIFPVRRKTMLPKP